MSLQVWLPLNGNLNNQGLSQNNITGSSVIYVGGKITNKCKSTGTITIPKATMDVIGQNHQVTIAMWFKPTGTSGSGEIFGGVSNRNFMNFFQYPNWDDLYISMQLKDTSTRNDYSTVLNDYFSDGLWHHICLVNNKGKIDFYKDGVKTNTVGTEGNWTRTTFSDFKLYSTSLNYINDFRIYDHCLSDKEIKELSKGLCLHYKLSRGGENLIRYDSSLTVADSGNVSLITSDYPNAISFKATGGNKRFYISTSNVWKTGITYSYSFWAKADSSVTIQPSRSIVDWGSSHTLTTSWKQYFGTIKSTATADGGTLSFTVNNTTSTVTIAQIKLEEGDHATSWLPNKSDTLYSQLGYNNIEPDCSGYGNDGTINGALTYSNDTPRYEGSSYFGYTQNVQGNFALNSFPITISFWAKVSQFDTSGWVVLAGQSTGYYLDADSSSGANWHSKVTVQSYYRDGALVVSANTTTKFISRDGEWHHYVYICTLTDWTKMTVNGGSLWSSSWRANVNISDFRIYATALSADDIKALYNNPISIDNNKNLHCLELDENDNVSFGKSGVVKMRFTDDTNPLGIDKFTED